MKNDQLLIAIASDLHCTYGGQSSSKVSYLLSDLPKLPINRHPVESLKKIIQAESIQADLLLCPGDISDKVDKQGLLSGWQYLQEIKFALNASSLISTLGNHDVDSRNRHNSGPFDFIKNLIDYKPTENESANDSFWRNGYCIVHTDEYLILVLNSCSNHTNEENAKVSLIHDSTLEKIEKELKEITDTKLIRIAMCHHHPLHHSNISYQDSDFIDKSDRLLLLLGELEFSIVIHGHKHEPRLVKFNSLPVFACGSFSSMANLLEVGAQNTFHLIKINTSTKKGVINTWIFQPINGWVQKHDACFPSQTGFGFSNDVKVLAEECSKWFASGGKESIDYHSIIKQFPDICNLIPSQQKELNELLFKKYELSFSPSLPNMPDRLYNIKQ